MGIVYEIMHGDKKVAAIDKSGRCKIFHSKFMPYDLYMEEEQQDIDTLVNNVINFQYWCASRVLTLDREYAKQILNSIGVMQATTDRDRANIALSYHCLSLTDIFWVRQENEQVSFDQINLFDHHLDEALIEISLRGKQMTVTNKELAQDLSTRGCFPKAWIRNEDGFWLLKDGGKDVVRRELLASRISQCFDIVQVKYEKSEYDKQIVTKSKITTSKDISIVAKAAFDIYAVNNDIDTIAFCQKLDAKAYYGMNIIDYLVGNTDRHPENWGFVVNNATNQPISLYPVMDFNQSFLSYDNLDGANCQTVLPRHLTQKEAAIEAVSQIGLPQIEDVDLEWFDDCKELREVFVSRLELLRSIAR